MRQVRRPVSFGNPALVTYSGCICTLEEDDDDGYESEEENDEIINSLGDSTNCVAAMIDVPPEQVPEGVLTLVRSHGPHVCHVRIVFTASEAITEVFSDDSDEEGKEEEEETNIRRRKSSSSFFRDASSSPLRQRFNSALSLSSSPVGSVLGLDEPSAAARVAAAAAAAAEIETSNGSSMRELMAQSDSDDDDNFNSSFQSTNMTYAILFHLISPQATREFVSDLHGRPYTSLQDDVTCSVYHVSKLDADGGGPSSLMNPIFGTSPISNNGGGRSKSPLTLMDGQPSSPPSLSSTNEGHNCPVCLERMDLTLLSSANSHQNSAESKNNNTHQSNDVLGNAATLSTTGPWTHSTASSSSLPSSTAIITTVCNHTFHLDCMVRCQDSPCPVCRYDHSGLNESLSQCSVCGTTENNYVCLICGVVSCAGPLHTTANLASQQRNQLPTFPSAAGNHDPQEHAAMDDDCNATRSNLRPVPPASHPNHPSNNNNDISHALRHYNETLHAYALDTRTQHVWDFAGQGYVHRLIQNASDGKLVEVSDPTNTTSHERSASPGFLSDVQEGEVVHRKLEGMASQYYALLKSQLEQQRIYYESRLQEMQQEFGGTTTVHGSCCADNGAMNHNRNRGAAAGADNSNNGGAGRNNRKSHRTQTDDFISALKQERHQLEQRCVTLRRKHQKILDDTSFLKDMNESLEANREPLRHQIEEAKREREETRVMISSVLPPLEDKVRSLMLQLEAGVTNTTTMDDSSSTTAATATATSSNGVIGRNGTKGSKQKGRRRNGGNNSTGRNKKSAIPDDAKPPASTTTT